MLEFILNQAMYVEKIQHTDPDISVYVVDNFLANPEVLVEYAREKPTSVMLAMTAQPTRVFVIVCKLL